MDKEDFVYRYTSVSDTDHGTLTVDFCTLPTMSSLLIKEFNADTAPEAKRLKEEVTL
jgi:hypothetical protein